MKGIQQVWAAARQATKMIDVLVDQLKTLKYDSQWPWWQKSLYSMVTSSWPFVGNRGLNDSPVSAGDAQPSLAWDSLM